MYQEKNKAYQGEVFVLKAYDMIKILQTIKKAALLKNKEMFEKMGVEVKNSNSEVELVLDKKQEMLLNMNLTKESFENLRGVKESTNILNLVVENPIQDYDRINGEINRLLSYVQEIGDNVSKIRNKKFSDIKFSRNYFFEEYIYDWIKTTSDYKKAEKDFNLEKTFGSFKDIDDATKEKVKEYYALLNMAERNIEHKEIAEGINASFVRYEIDLENNVMNIYNAYAKFIGTNPKKFIPWKYKLQEDLVETLIFKDIKKQAVLNFLSFESPDKKLSKIVKGRNFLEEELEKSNKTCPINQHSQFFFDLMKEEMQEQVIILLGFMQGYNLFKRQVYKVQVSNNNSNIRKNKKKKNVTNMQNEYFSYNEQDLKNVIKSLEATE